MLCNDRSRATSRVHPELVAFGNAFEQASVTDECLLSQDVAVRPNELRRRLGICLERLLEVLFDLFEGRLFG
ncbi:hypothetical protein GCM10007209_15780 [Haloferax sulfurifontis]|uniref:Uncharacterized protein n=1 Tax=Haloferax sulfurifontis TaxID=255616 RepID=A0A830DQN9_9EURY|nr:hypothetical protein GCM10007209_15780 [Haloferax sulfurifontis]